MNVLHFNGKRGTYAGAIPRINPLVLADIGIAQARLESLAKKVPTDAPWNAARAERWDGQTFETWARRNTVSRSAYRLLALAAEAVFAAEPGDLSLLHVLFYSHSGGAFQNLIATTGGAQQDRFVGGSALIAERLADRLGPETVKLGAPVSKISVTGGKVTATTAVGQFDGKRIIVTAPPLLAGRIEYEPSLPYWREQLTQRARWVRSSSARSSMTSRSGVPKACPGRPPGTGKGRGWCSTTPRLMARPESCWPSLRVTKRADSAGKASRFAVPP